MYESLVVLYSPDLLISIMESGDCLFTMVPVSIGPCLPGSMLVPGMRDSLGSDFEEIGMGLTASTTRPGPVVQQSPDVPSHRTTLSDLSCAQPSHPSTGPPAGSWRQTENAAKKTFLISRNPFSGE